MTPVTDAAVPVVLFDLDDTLFAHQHAVATGVAAHMRLLGGPLAAADAATELARWHALEEVHYHRYLSGEIDYIAQRRARSRAFLEPYGISLADDRAADSWFDAYLVQYRRAWKLYDDTLPCLDVIAAAQVRIGIITNGEIDFQSLKVDAAGLSAYVEHVIASGELGYAKPDPRIFATACSRFHTPPAEALYIGDRLATDAIGAARAGLRGVWLDREATATDEQLAEAAAAGVSVIHSLAELPALALGRP